MGLGGRFDIVGFDPRGVDRSGGHRLHRRREPSTRCCTPTTHPTTPSKRRPASPSRRCSGQACRQVYGDTLRHYSTENTARDMDMIRAALGDEQLSYIGVSYGTYLGGVYATLFPERVRAMVLDSAYEPTGDSEYDQWVTQLVGFEQAFANWAAWCEEGTRVRLHRRRRRRPLGSPDRRPRGDPGEVRQRPAGQPRGDGDGDDVGDVQRARLAVARRRPRRRRGGRRHRPAGDGRRLQRAVERRDVRQHPPVRSGDPLRQRHRPDDARRSRRPARRAAPRRSTVLPRLRPHRLPRHVPRLLRRGRRRRSSRRTPGRRRSSSSAGSTTRRRRSAGPRSSPPRWAPTSRW